MKLALSKRQSGLSHAPPLGVRFERAESPVLRDALSAGGLCALDDPHAPLVTHLDALNEADGGDAPIIALYDGRLAPEHAPLFERDVPPLLLACREADGYPSLWEVRALAAFLSGRPLTSVVPATLMGFRVEQHADLHEVSRQAETMARESGAGSRAAAALADVTYELAANALFDAPADDDGVPKYAHRRGATPIDGEDACDVALVVTSGQAWVSATDRFGRLTAAPLARVVAALGEKAQLDGSGGGAGLGMRRAVQLSDLCAMRVTEGTRSEVLCVLDLADARGRTARPKSLFFARHR